MSEWIKLEHVTPDKPEVYQMATFLGTTPEHVVGCLARAWVWADQQTLDGNAPSVTKALLDRVTHQPQMTEAMLSVCWLTPRGDGYLFVNFDRHNGETAKKRALSSKRMKRFRYADNVTSALPEKRREDIPPISPANNKRSKRPLPPDFGISDRVSRWLAEHRIENGDRHLEYFVGYARANGKCYADWDQALMNAIRDDWAKIGDGRMKVAL